MSYTVYENDLKFKQNRNIDPARANWFSEHIKNEHAINHDDLKYRLHECAKNKYDFLDLSHMSLDTIPKLPDKSFYNVKYLFLNDNNLQTIENSLDDFHSLEVLDLSNNNITHISKLPNTIKEFVCHNNKLKTIPSSDHIIKIDCSYNSINMLNNYPVLKDMICHDNKLISIPTYKNVTRIVCRNNPITYINDQPNVLYIDCSDTNMDKLTAMVPNLKHFICNNTQIADISNLKNLVILEISGCKNLKNIPYLPKLQDLLFQNTINLFIEEKYKVKQCITQKDHTYIKFS